MISAAAPPGPAPLRPLGLSLGIGQTEPVLVVLDRAVPAGPWDARILLRSGLTEREATAEITFPAAADSSSQPVAGSAPADGKSRVLPALLAAAALVALSLAAYRLARSRRPRSPGKVGQAAEEP